MKGSKYPYKSLYDPNAYQKGYALGMEMARKNKPFQPKHNPYSKLLKPKSYHAFDLGLRMGFQRGVEIIEQAHTRDLLFKEHKNREKELQQLEEHQ